MTFSFPLSSLINCCWDRMAARALNWYQRLGLNKWYTNFRLEHSVRKNRTTFSDVPLLPESFHWNDPKSSLRRRHSTPPVGFDNAWAGCNAGYPKSRVPFTFQPKFPESCCKWETTKVSNAVSHTLEQPWNPAR